MKTNVHVFWILCAFFFVSAAVYTVWALVDPFHGYVEWVGTIGLSLCGILFALVAFYLGRVHAHQGGELPEDIESSDIDDGDPEIGFFSPWSWWPMTLGAGAALTFLGLAIGIWISFIGASLAFVSLVGWMFEYYRGYFGR